MPAQPSQSPAGRNLFPVKAPVPFTDEECQGLQHALALHLPPELLNTRSAFGGTRLTYLEGWRAISLANELFGFNGWSSQVIDTTVDFCDVTPDNRFSLGLSCTVRITLKDGTFHEDIGYGSIDNARTKALAFEKAKKEAVTDAMKRALRMFGNCLGNCLYSKQYLRQIGQFSHENPPPVTQAGLYRPHKHHIYSAYQLPSTDPTRSPHPAPAPASHPSGSHLPQSPRQAQSPALITMPQTTGPTLRPVSQLIKASSPSALEPGWSGNHPTPAPPTGMSTDPSSLPAAPFRLDVTVPGPQILR
ncbi:DNA repair protein rad52 [Dimargaris verticillata]|uniref:DNA repair protein rad52 n=1 Tax=Dimargaris verticillata TaxID=2761393 RepID=A0A9W8EB04_9FUNG|nr:DNA repair protein rad52 [Dimargaris verticillata]